MKLSLSTSIGIIVLCIAGEKAQAQNSVYEGGISIGAFVYRGDLTPSAIGSYRTASWNANVFVNRLVNDRVSIRANLAFGRLEGNDAAYAKPDWRKERAFRFGASVTEASALLVWNKWGTSRRVTPYLLGGAGLSFVSIHRDWSSFNGDYFSRENLSDRLAEDVSRQPPRFIPVLQGGGGLRYQLTDRISLAAETTLRFTRTDYLDGFSIAANSDRNDHYASHTIGIIYRFGKQRGIDCPVVKN